MTTPLGYIVVRKRKIKYNYIMVLAPILLLAFSFPFIFGVVFIGFHHTLLVTVKHLALYENIFFQTLNCCKYCKAADISMS